MNEQKQDLLAFLRELQFVIERHRATITLTEDREAFISTGRTESHYEMIRDAFNGECPSLAEAIERLESELTPQRETPDEDGTSYL